MNVVMMMINNERKGNNFKRRIEDFIKSKKGQSVD
jgi:hypothetical protein